MAQEPNDKRTEYFIAPAGMSQARAEAVLPRQVSNLPDCARLRALHKRHQYQTAPESCQVGIASTQMLQNLWPQPLKALHQRRRERRSIVQRVGRRRSIEVSAERWGDPDEGKRRVSPPVRMHLQRAEIDTARGSVPCVGE